MGLEATWKITCDGCGLVHETRVVLSRETVNEGWFDIWGPGIPEGWMQRSGEVPLFFHDTSCYRAWLLPREGQEAVDDFDNAVWIA